MFDQSFWMSVLSNFLATVAGGGVITFIFFILKEKIFALPQLSGMWECEETTDNSNLSKMHGVKVTYKLTLVQNGAEVHGGGERHSESNADGSHVYANQHRTPIVLRGYISKRILSRDVVNFHWHEDGARAVTDVQLLTMATSNAIAGRFHKTAANSNGTVLWKRIWPA